MAELNKKKKSSKAKSPEKIHSSSSSESSLNEKDSSQNLEVEISKLLKENHSLNEKLRNALVFIEEMKKENETQKEISLRENQKMKSFAIFDFAKSLCEVIDDFDRAIASINSLKDSKEKSSFIMGFKMIRSSFLNVLSQYHIKKIETENQFFDPNFHEAVSKQKSEKLEKGKIISEVTAGYIIKDKLLRPAKVVVAE